MTTPPIVPVVLATDTASHLWPSARDTVSKQFVSLLDGGQSMFQATLRLLDDEGFDRPIVVTSTEARFVAADQMQAVGIDGDIILAPQSGKRAAEAAVGMLLATDRQPNTTCVLVHSDQWIRDKEAFAADCRSAAAAARRGATVAFGLPADARQTTAGHLHLAGVSEAGFFTVREVVERPNGSLGDGMAADTLRDSGSFVSDAGRFMQQLKAVAPDIAQAATASLANATRDLDFIRLEPDSYQQAAGLGTLAVIGRNGASLLASKPQADWLVIDSWDALHTAQRKDDRLNVLSGPVVSSDCSGSIVRSDETLVAVSGLTDMIVVAHRDAVLVAPRAQADKVETLMAQLRQAGRSEVTEHLRVYRPWGWYQRIDVGPRFQVKRIFVKPGGKLSLQRHFHRAEHWVVVTGAAEVTVDGKVSVIHENQSVHLPIGCIHRLANPGKIPLELIEVQVGSYTGEDDIVRIEDIYARG
jgi:mannose-1-phosphate guanylyltransferase/mannose-6-phosphate isomerase